MPSHRPVFDRLQHAKVEGEGLVHFCHMNDISVYLGSQRRGGISHRKKKNNVFCTHVLCFEL